VIAGTVLAALNAHLPESTRRTVYLLDDGRSIEKRAFIESLENPQVGIVHFGSLFDAFPSSIYCRISECQAAR